jgi:outer membrane protein TolC
MSDKFEIRSTKYQGNSKYEARKIKSAFCSAFGIQKREIPLVCGSQRAGEIRSTKNQEDRRQKSTAPQLQTENSKLKTLRPSMKTRPLLLLSILLVCWASGAAAQSDTTYLSLQDCIRLARLNGPLGTIARSTYDSKEATNKAFFASYLPQLSLRGDVPGYYRSINAITLPDGSTIFTPQSQASSQVSLSLSQKIPFTGGQLFLSSGLNRIDLMDPTSQYYKSSPFSMTLQQPIFQINTYRWDMDAQELRYTMATRELAEAMEDCALDVTSKFFDFYMATLTASNAALNLAINDTLYKISKGRFNVGKIAENDLLQSELAYLNAQTQLENANVGLNRSANNLKIALGMPASKIIVLLPPSKIPDAEIDPAKALEQALLNRSDAVNFELQRLNAERNVRQAKSDNFFSATLTASMGYNQRAPLFNDAYNNLLEQRQFSVNFTIPIFKWGAGSATVDAAIADQKRTEVSLGQQRHDFEQEVLYQAARLNLLRKQVAVAMKSDTIAQRRFDVAKDRYLIGKIDVPNLFLAQSEKDNARRANSQTLWDYWTAYYRIRRLTLYDFETKESLVAGKGE